MSRWKVARHEVTSWLGTSYQWCVMDADNFQIRDFATHTEALAYADRMARTREVVLPRLTPLAVEALSQKRFLPYDPDHAETFALSILAYKELALAEQEETK